METGIPGLNRHIFLTGFMGVGKTTVGRILAERLGWIFLDLDRAIEERTGRSIPELFSEFGEEHFRHEESSCLESLPLDPPMVIATGGGIIGREANRHLMRSRGTVIFLELPWVVLRKRLQAESGRPLANGRDGWERVEKLLQTRLPLYRKAELNLNCTDLTPEQVVERILQMLSNAEEVSRS